MSTDNQGDTKEQNAPKKKRVNITIPPSVHEAAKETAKEQGTNFSKLVTRRLLDTKTSSITRNNANESGVTRKKLESVEEQVKYITELVESQQDLVKRITENITSDRKQFADRIETELEDTDQPLSIPDLTDRLLLNPEEIEAGLRHLEKRFAVERIASSDADTDVPRWELP